MTGDRGLAGPFNAQILRRAFALERELRGAGQGSRWLVVGKKGRSTLTFRRYDLAQAWIGFTDRPGVRGRGRDRAPRGRALHRARGRPGRDRLQPLHLAADAGGRDVDLLPIPRQALEEDEEKSPYEIALEGDFIYEPEPEMILERLLPAYLETTIYRALLESAASEHRGADDGDAQRLEERDELIDRLTLDMNRAAAGGDHPGDPRGRSRRRRFADRRARPATSSSSADGRLRVGPPSRIGRSFARFDV